MMYFSTEVYPTPQGDTIREAFVCIYTLATPRRSSVKILTFSTPSNIIARLCRPV